MGSTLPPRALMADYPVLSRVRIDTRALETADALTVYCPNICLSTGAGCAAARCYFALSASNTLAGCSSALGTLAQCFLILLSGPIHTVERITPTVFLPYIIFSPQAP